MNGPEHNAGFVFSDFGLESGEAQGQPLEEEIQQQEVLNEIVIECPVVVEFVGGGLSPEARDEVVLAVMDQIACAVSRT